ncbi:MAG TPA: aquaporin [Gemmatimonadales bacterium]|nr:aquaporin [Gemmatimonadales bacterium]
MAKYVTEFIGPFIFILTIGLTVVGQSPMAPLAIGAALMVMVYMGGHVSGAHYNPAVSLALVLRGKLSSAEFVPYVIAQLAGALVAGFTVKAVLGQTFAPAPGDGVAPLSALLVELLYTFALVLVVLNSAASEKTKGNSFYGLAIGFTIVVAAFAGGPVSGGAFNPAIGIGPTVVHALLGGGTWGHLWLYIVGPLVGGALAAMVFGMQEDAR